jgi:hypothetical protein
VFKLLGGLSDGQSVVIPIVDGLNALSDSRVVNWVDDVE